MMHDTTVLFILLHKVLFPSDVIDQGDRLERTGSRCELVTEVYGLRFSLVHYSRVCDSSHCGVCSVFAQA